MEDPVQAVQVNTADDCRAALDIFSGFQGELQLIMCQPPSAQTPLLRCVTTIQDVFWFEFRARPVGCLLYQEGAMEGWGRVVVGPREPLLATWCILAHPQPGHHHHHHHQSLDSSYYGVRLKQPAAVKTFCDIYKK